VLLGDGREGLGRGHRRRGGSHECEPPSVERGLRVVTAPLGGVFPLLFPVDLGRVAPSDLADPVAAGGAAQHGWLLYSSHQDLLVLVSVDVLAALAGFMMQGSASRRCSPPWLPCPRRRRRSRSRRSFQTSG